MIHDRSGIVFTNDAAARLKYKNTKFQGLQDYLGKIRKTDIPYLNNGHISLDSIDTGNLLRTQMLFVHRTDLNSSQVPLTLQD